MARRRSSHLALVLLLILLLAGALRIYNLGGESLWYDESYSIVNARLSLSDILTVVPKRDYNPPLYFLMLHGWVRLVGEAAGAIRMLSAIFGVAAVAVLFLVGLELRDASLGLAVAFLSAISYFLIRYAQEARPYSLLVLLSATSYYFFIRMVRRGETGGVAVGYAASTALLFYTHYHAAFLVLAQICTVACLWRRLGKVRLRWLAAVAVATLAFSPWLPTLWTQIQILAGGEWWVPIPTIRTLAGIKFFWIANPFLTSIGPFVIRLHRITAVLFLTLVFMGCLTWAKAPPSMSGTSWFRPIGWAPLEETVILVLWLLVPILVPFTLSQTSPSIFLSRYIIGVAPAFYLLVARGVVVLNRRWFAGGLCLLILALSMPGLLRFYRTPQKEQWGHVARVVEREGRPGGLVVLSQRWVEIPWTYHYRGSLDRFAVSDDDGIDEVAEQIKAAMVGHRRIWLIVSRFSPRETAVKALGALVPKGAVAQHRFVGMKVFLYEIPPHFRRDR